MSSKSQMSRPVLLAVLAVAVAGASGCSWLRKGNDAYAQSPESRPLEVPPDLDLPNTAGAMRTPEAGGSVTRSSMATAAPAAASSSGFTVQGERSAVFARVGEALAATDGVVIASAAPLLGTYDVDYRGSKFLLRVSSVAGGTNVAAVDARGLPASGEAATALMASLKAALGG